MLDKKDQLFICPQSESLQCFLARSKGRRCSHCYPHKFYTFTCIQEKCSTVDGDAILNCECVPIEEDDNEKSKVDL